ncbi:MAG: DUF2262 domain-containing protein [Pirellulales bacterium]
MPLELLRRWIERVRLRRHPLQGLWQVDGVSMGGRRILTDTAYFLFRGTVVREISSTKIDGGLREYFFSVDDDCRPAKIQCRNVRRVDAPVVRCGRYRVADETLEICYGWSGTEPESLERLGPDDMLYRCHRRRSGRPIVKRRTQTPPLLDDVLGTMHWDDERECYEGEFTFEGRELEVSLTPWRDGGLEPAIRRASRILAEIENFDARARRAVVRDLLAIGNEVWSKAGERQLTAAEFEHRISLTAIDFGFSQYASFLYDCGELFLDHAIETVLNPAGEFEQASLIG